MSNRYLIIGGMLGGPSLLLQYLLNGFSEQWPSVWSQACGILFLLSWLCLSSVLWNMAKRSIYAADRHLTSIHLLLLCALCLMKCSEPLLIVLHANVLLTALYVVAGLLFCIILGGVVRHLRPATLSWYLALISLTSLITGCALWFLYLHVPGALVLAVVCLTVSLTSFGGTLYLEQESYKEQENDLYELSSL
jgi:hypothetical protein